MSDAFDPFKFDIGLKDDYDGMVSSGEFEQSQRGNWGCKVTVQADDGEAPEIVLGLGKDWVSYDGGQTVEGPTPKSRFNERSGWAKFLASAMTAGAKDELYKRSATYDNRGPMHASLLNGMRFHFDVIHEPGQRPGDDGVWKDVEGGIPVVRPTKYLGLANGAPSNTAPVSTPQPVQAAQPATTSPETTNGATHNDIHPDDLRTLKISAATSDNHESFADTVMGLKKTDGTPMLKDKSIMTQLASREWYESLKV